MEKMPDGLDTLFIIVGGFVVMAVGLWFVFARLKQKQQGFGPNSIKALGLVLLLPAVLIAAAVGQDFKSETLAALLGTVAGFVLSRSKDEDD